MNSKNFQTKLLELQGNLLNFAYLLTSNHDDAYDLLQDTTLKALSNEEKYIDNTNFKGWVFTIMRNTFINNYRQMAKSTATIDDMTDLCQLDMTREANMETPEESISETEITAAINSFADDYRVPFAMHIAGYKYDEIAVKMNLPLGTVKSRIFFTRKRLQEMLKDFR